MNNSQKKEFEEISNKMIEFINENVHPHAKVIIDSNSAEIVEGTYIHSTKVALTVED